MLSKLQACLKENLKFVNCLRPQESKISLSVIIPMCKIFDYLGLGQRLHVILKVIMIVGSLTGVLGDALGLGPVTNSWRRQAVPSTVSFRLFCACVYRIY